MSQIKHVFVACATCGAEVDRIEYDDGAASPAVTAVADALGVDAAEAARLVKKANPGAELSSEDNARALAAAVVAGKVDGRRADECPNGHTDLTVSDSNPTPAVTTTIAKENTR